MQIITRKLLLVLESLLEQICLYNRGQRKGDQYRTSNSKVIPHVVLSNIET